MNTSAAVHIALHDDKSPTLARTYRIGVGYVVRAMCNRPTVITGTVKPVFEWKPAFPGMNRLSQIERADYDRVAANFAQEIAKWLDIDVGGFDIGAR